MSIVPFSSSSGEPWPSADLSYLGTGRRPAPAFPLSTLGSKWADLVEAVARAASAPIDYVGASLLAIASALLGNVRWPKAGAEWQEAAVLWVVLVGSPGSGKSPGQDLLLACLRNVEDRLDPDYKERLDGYEKERAVAEIRWGQWKTAVKDAVEAGKALSPSPGPLPVRPERPRVRISDTTAEKAGIIAAAHPRGLLLCRDEIAGWLGSFDRYASGSSDRPFFLEAHGGRSYPIDGVKLAEPIVIRHLSIAVLGGIQPERLVKIVGGADDGLLGRFLYVFPENIPTFELRRQAVDVKAVENAFARLIELPIGGSEEKPDSVIVPLTREAEDELETFAREMQKLGNESIGRMAGVYAKARGQAMRLANVLEHLYWAIGEECYDTPPAWIDRPALAPP